MVRINSKYKKLYSSKKRYFIVTGGRGSGKTYAVKDYLVRLLEQKGQGILYTRYTMVSVETSIIPLFTKHIEEIADLSNYHITKKKIINKRTGSFILFSGIKTSSGDQTANLKTLPDITTWVIEEGEDFNKEDAFVDIDDSIRVLGIQNRIIWIQNPSTREHFIYKKFFEKTHTLEPIEGANSYIDEEGNTKRIMYQRSTHQDVEHIHTTYFDNRENLDKNKVASWDAVITKDPLKWQHKYGGAWLDRKEGVIFSNWIEGEFDVSLPYGYGQDYGFSKDPTTLIKCAVDEKRKRIYVHECFYSTFNEDGTPLGQESIYNINVSNIAKPFDLIVADSQADRLIYDLQHKGINIEKCKKGAGSVEAGILAMQDYEIVVTPESNNIKVELNNYVWNNKKAGIPTDDFNHAIDSIRYIFKFLQMNDNQYTIL